MKLYLIIVLLQVVYVVNSKNIHKNDEILRNNEILDKCLNFALGCVAFCIIVVVSLGGPCLCMYLISKTIESCKRVELPTTVNASSPPVSSISRNYTTPVSSTPEYDVPSGFLSVLYSASIHSPPRIASPTVAPSPIPPPPSYDEIFPNKP